MGEERRESEIRVESEGTVAEVVAEHNSTKKKKKKSRENKDIVAGEDEETSALERGKLGEDALAKKKSEKMSVNSEADDGGVKKSKKRNEEKGVDSDGVKKPEMKSVVSEAEDGEKKSKKRNEEKSVVSEAGDGEKKSKKKKKKKSKKESGGDEIGNREGNQSDGTSLVNTDNAKRETGKRKRDDDSDLGAEENTDKEIKRKSKKKKPCVDSEVEENSLSSAKDAEKKLSENSKAEEKNLNSMKDAKKKRKKKKQSEDSDAEGNNNDGTKDAKKKPSEDPEVEEKNDSTKDANSKQTENSEAEENGLNTSENAKKKRKKKKRSEDPEAGENNKEEAKKKRKKKQKCSKSDEDVTTPSSKSAKKVKFSDQVEVFPAEDEESEEEEEEEVELVRGTRFTKEEDELIKKAVLEYVDNHALDDEGVNMIMNCKSHPQLRGCWKEIRTALPWRPKNAVYHRAHTIFEEGSRGVWTKEDFDLLIEYEKKHGKDWRALADAMGKHRKHVKDAWRRIRLRSKKKGHWSRQEYQTLFDLVNKDIRMKAFQEKRAKHGMLRDNIPWMAISDQLETRDHTLCCIKWYDQLQSPMVAKGIWANVDDYRLLDELTNLDAACVDDVDWDNLLDNRDGEACRKRWDQMVRCIGFPGTKTFAEQVEILSERYCPDLAEDREDFDNRPFDPED